MRGLRRTKSRCASAATTRRACASRTCSPPTAIDVGDGRRSSPARTSASCSPAIRCRKAIARRWCRFAPSARSIRICSRTRASAIENALREQGYRAARAPYTREEKGGELVADVHDRARPAASRRVGRDRRARCAITRRRPRAAAADQGRRSVRRSARRPGGRGHHRAVSRPRLRAGGRQAQHPGAAARRQRVNVTYRPVAIRFEIQKGRRPSSAASTFEGTDRDPGRAAASADGACRAASRSTVRSCRSIATRSSARIATRAFRASR